MRSQHHKLVKELTEEELKSAMAVFKRHPTSARAEQIRSAQMRRWRLENGTTDD